MNSDAMLSGTGQAHRLAVCGLMFALGFVLATIAPVVYFHDMFALGLFAFTLGALLLLVPTWIALKTTRCPRCGLPWLQFALGERPMGNWIQWLITFTSCPGCSLTLERRAETLSPSNQRLERP